MHLRISMVEIRLLWNVVGFDSDIYVGDSAKLTVILREYRAQVPNTLPVNSLFDFWYSYWCCLGFAPRTQLLKKSTACFTLIGDKAPTAHDSSEVAREQNQRYL